jgi:transcription elongation factor Elf1
MGNKISFTCPKCNHSIHQSLDENDYSDTNYYDENHVPVKIAEEIDGVDVHCDECDESFVVVVLSGEYKKVRLVKE